MSDNVYNGKNLHVNGGVKVLGIDFTDPKAFAKAPLLYTISNNDGASIDLVGWEGILLPLAILMDALHRETVREGIRKPTREQLDQLRDLIDKWSLIPPESEQR